MSGEERRSATSRTLFSFGFTSTGAQSRSGGASESAQETSIRSAAASSPGGDTQAEDVALVVSEAALRSSSGCAGAGDQDEEACVGTEPKRRKVSAGWISEKLKTYDWLQYDKGIPVSCKFVHDQFHCKCFSNSWAFSIYPQHVKPGKILHVFPPQFPLLLHFWQLVKKSNCPRTYH